MMWTFLVVILLSIACRQHASRDSDDKLLKIHTSLNTYYDSFRPPLRIQFAGQSLTPVKASNYHAKRCSHTDPGSAITMFLNGVYEKQLQDEPILVGSPCLFSDSLGNWLSNYFETILCAKAAGMHYVSVAKIWEPKTNDTSEPFLAKLPSVIKHAKPVTNAIAKASLSMSCPCQSLCHEKPNALWTKSRDAIKDLMWGAIDHHRNTRKLTNTTILSSDLSNRAPGTVLPFVPNVAIHYRCGDNFVGHYGFLPFSAFRKLIPAGSQTIFVLAETRSRKTSTKMHRATKCDAIFASLFGYLRREFPQSDVVIRRGDDLYSDLIRLSSAQTTICSVSSFCLWPAFVNPNTAYFPLTKLVVRHDASLNLGFKWIAEPKVLLGSHFENLPNKVLIDKLETM